MCYGITDLLIYTIVWCFFFPKIFLVHGYQRVQGNRILDVQFLKTMRYNIWRIIMSTTSKKQMGKPYWYEISKLFR